MTKNLEKFRDGLVLLNNSKKIKFHFNSIVEDSEIREKNICGTVCCAVGMPPEIFPESFSWQGNADFIEVFYLSKSINDNSRLLNDFFLLGEHFYKKLDDILFDLYIYDTKKTVTLSEVIEKLNELIHEILSYNDSKENL